MTNWKDGLTIAYGAVKLIQSLFLQPVGWQQNWGLSPPPTMLLPSGAQSPTELPLEPLAEPNTGCSSLLSWHSVLRELHLWALGLGQMGGSKCGSPLSPVAPTLEALRRPWYGQQGAGGTQGISTDPPSGKGERARGRDPLPREGLLRGTAAPVAGGDLTSCLPRPPTPSRNPRRSIFWTIFLAPTLPLQCRRLYMDANRSPRRMAKRVASQCRRDSEAAHTQECGHVGKQALDQRAWRCCCCGVRVRDWH